MTAPEAAGAREPAARLARSWRGRGDRPRGRWWAGPVGLVALLCLGSFTVSLVLQATLYRHGSGDADEAAYVLQARMLLHGRLTLDAASMEPFFRPWLTGEHGGRLFTKYLPGWPALLAASQAAFGTMAVAPALVAAAWVAGTYQLARELFDDAATGLLAAAAVALSPLVWLHTALPLAYGCGAATLTLTAAALLRGARTASRGWLLAAGAGAGFALLLRPYDAVLVLAPVAAFALLRLWRDVRRGRVVGGDRTGGDRTDAGPTDAGPTGVVAVASRRAGWVLLGAAPFLALLLAYCWWVTGSPLRMPLSASDPLDRFGFGPRRILPSEPTFPFGRRLALKAARQTVEAAPSWLFGGSVLAVLAAVGALGARRRGARLLLVAMVLAVVGGYLFWWGSAFAMPGLRTGLGPHYHLAALSPVVILAAAGARSVWSAAGLAIAGTAWARAARPATAGALVVLMGALTVASLPGKVRDQRGVNDRVALVHALLPREYSAPSVVVVTPDTPSRYTQVPFQTLRNGPDLSGRVLYAADLGPATATLPDRMPGRTLYRLRPGEIVDPAAWLSYHGSFTLLRPVDAARVRVELQVSLPAGAAPTSGVASTTGTASALAADVAPAA
ncbi:glycosyltransferase family 39 protein, partial [Frankia canadensis]|uniref:glycosyltransferase family 39 protein n=1 Tax=Frankia canadensis TaxID=1836972 RepID=UPI001FAFB2F4